MKKALLFIVLFLLSVQNNYAQEVRIDTIQKHKILTDRLLFNVGVFIPSKLIKVRVDGATNNEVIDFNQAFKFNENDLTFALNFTWRFSKSKRWNVGVEYFSLKSSNNATLEKDISWEDRTYLAGGNVEAGFGLRLYRLFFGRSISIGTKHEFFGGLGIHTMDVETYIEGNVYIDTNSAEFNIDRKKVDVIAPVPNVGLTYIYAPNKKWAFLARADWFSLKVKEYNGLLWNIAPGVKYQIGNNFGVGVNYRYFETKIDLNKERLHGGVLLIYKGPFISVSGNF